MAYQVCPTMHCSLCVKPAQTSSAKSVHLLRPGPKGHSCAVTTVTHMAPMSHVTHDGVQESQQQACLLDSLHALTWLRQLDQHASSDPAALMDLFSLAASILAETGTLGHSHGAFLQTCLQHVSCHLPSLGEPPGHVMVASICWQGQLCR